MGSQKHLKIDLNNDYPCPCRRHGRLLPIILTEAFGCDRCQQIFVLQENGQVIEQLSSSHPYKPMWRWTGYHWLPVHNRFRESYLSVLMGIVLLLLFIWIPLVLRGQPTVNMTVWLAIILLLVLLPVVLLWLAYRR